MLLYLFFSAALGATCPIYTCNYNQSLDYNECVKFDSLANTYTLTPCPNRYLSCPHPANWSESEFCENWNNVRRWTAQSSSEYLEYQVKQENEQCELVNSIDPCQEGLVCNCSGSSCKCTTTLQEGDNCSNSTLVCKETQVCSMGKCVERYSLPEGEEADNVEACKVGASLISGNNFTFCSMPRESFGTLPVKCETDQDCISTVGTVYTKCKCGITTDGTGYCELHEGDEPKRNFKYAIKNKDWEQLVYWKFVTENWPYIQGSVPECLANVWKDYNEYQKGEPDQASYLLLSALLLNLL